jgi:hypothetical protein
MIWSIVIIAAAIVVGLAEAFKSDAATLDGATALCSDGTFSFSSNCPGTCSHHGGVAQWQ